MDDEHNTNQDSGTIKPDSQQPQPTVTNSESPVSTGFSHRPGKTSKLKWLVIGWVLLAFLGGVAWILTNDSNNKQIQNSEPITSDAATVSSPKPFGIIYMTTDQDTQKQTLHIKPFGEEDAKSIPLEPDVYVTQHDTYQEKLTYVTERSSENENQTSIWYSPDGGTTVEKLYESSGTSESGLGDQITSLVFSRDGKSLLFAQLAAGESRKNTVKQLDLQSKKVTDIFSVDEAGVFIAGFDTQEGKIHYYSGCYNCDGNTRNKLLVHDVTDGSNKTIYDFDDRTTADFAINSSHNKILVLKGSQSEEGLGDGPPYNLVEIDLETKTETAITSSKKSIGTIGYRAGDDLPFYAQSNKINSFDNGKVTTIFETENPIYTVYLVSTDFVIGSTGDFQKEKVFKYDYADKNITSLFNISGDRILGLSWR